MRKRKLLLFLCSMKLINLVLKDFLDRPLTDVRVEWLVFPPRILKVPSSDLAL